MKKVVAIAVFILMCGMLNAQNDPQYSLNSYCRLMYNPASIAQSDHIEGFISAREQWTGFEDAPSTQSLAVSNYFEKWGFGLGLTAINDNIGVESYQNIKAKYVFHAWLADDNYISLGVGAGVLMKTFSSAGLIFEEQNDEHITDGDLKKSRFDVDLGFEWQVKSFFMGFSANHITKNSDDPEVLQMPRHHYGYVGFKLKASEEISFIPSLTVMNVENITNYTGEVIMNYNDQFWFGLGYRAEDALILSTRLALVENLVLAYSYDMGAGELRSYREGSHEIMLQFRIPKSDKQYRSTRFFD